jgi:hypothetical protein
MLPRSYRTRAVLRPDAAHAARLSSDYLNLDLDGPPFDMSDAISLAVLLARDRKQGSTHFTDFYEKAYAAVLSALRLPERNRLAEVLGLCPQPHRARSSPEMFRGAGIRRFLWLRAQITDFQDPFWGVGVGDIWGLSVFGREGPRRDVIASAVAWYDAEADRLLDGYARIDRALCLLTEWYSARDVPVRRLIERCGMPNPNEVFLD